MSNVRIGKLMLVPTSKSYNQVVRRSFSLNATSGDLRRFEKTLEERVAANALLGTPLLAKEFSNMIQPDLSNATLVDVPHGWQTQRLRFLMEVIIDLGVAEQCLYIQGFTEYHDPSFSGELDPNMLFFINSVTEVNRSVDNYGRMIVRPSATYNVISDLAGGESYKTGTSFLDNPSSNDLVTLRPTDIVNSVSVEDKIAYGELGGRGDVKINNKLGVITGDAVGARRKYSSGAMHLTDTLNTLIKGRNSLDDGTIDATIGTALDLGSYTVQEQTIGMNGFYDTLKQLSGTTTKFTLGILERIDPAIGSKTFVAGTFGGISSYTNTTVLDSENTENNLQPTLENTIVTTIASNISSFMSENMLTEVYMTITNKSTQNIASIHNIETFITGVNKIPYLNRLATAVEDILMPIITHNGMLLIEVIVHADLLGDTSCFVSVNDQPSVLFRVPTFADSLYSPVIGDSENKERLTQEYYNLFDSIINVTSEQMGNLRETDPEMYMDRVESGYINPNIAHQYNTDFNHTQMPNYGTNNSNSQNIIVDSREANTAYAIASNNQQNTQQTDNYIKPNYNEVTGFAI